MGKMKFLIDTSAWYAYFNKKDPQHHNITSIFQDDNIFCTSNLVFLETVALMQKRVGKKASLKASSILLNEKIVNFIILDKEQMEKSYKLYQDTPSSVSFVDCSNKIVYQDFDMDAIACFDKHFKDLGLKIVP